MLESGKNAPAAEELNRVVARLLAQGADGAQIVEMVAERITTLTELASTTLAPDVRCDEDAEVMYEPGQLPDGLIDLPSAAKKYEIPVVTLRAWMRRGKIPFRGRLRGKAAGGGFLVTEKRAIQHARENPRKPWHNKSATP